MTLKEFLDTHNLCHGVGELDAKGQGECCSIAAMNYVRFGVCDDKIRPEDSRVVGCWIRAIQDSMPVERINGERWKSALLSVPGLGQDPDKEQARLRILMDWMWGTVLPQLQSVADQHGFGVEWSTMITEMTTAAARSAADAAAWNAADAAAWNAADAAWDAADAAWDAADAARAAADAARAAAAADAARAADAADAARAADAAGYWDAVRPEAVLEKLVTVVGSADRAD